MTTIQDALNEFLLDQQARMNSSKTIKDYREKISLWATFANNGRSIGDVSRHEMREYVAHLRERDLARDTVRSYIRALRVFWRFIADEYQIDNAMATIKEPKRRKPTPKTITGYDFNKLLNAIDETDSGIRDRAILCLLADTGARLGGIASLTTKNLDCVRRRGIVTEKNSVQHTIYWTHYTNQMLGKWLAVRPDCETDSLFVTMREGREVEGLTRSGIYQVLKRLKRRAGVEGRANPHAFRHNFAKQYILSGGDIGTLAKLLNHKDVNLTAQYYAIFDHNELSQLQAEHSPLLKMLNKGIES